jgi:hypothetical protein
MTQQDLIQREKKLQRDRLAARKKYWKDRGVESCGKGRKSTFIECRDFVEIDNTPVCKVDISGEEWVSSDLKAILE